MEVEARDLMNLNSKDAGVGPSGPRGKAIIMFILRIVGSSVLSFYDKQITLTCNRRKSGFKI